MECLQQTFVQSSEVYWQPWSEFIISGAPCPETAASRTSMELAASSVLCSPHAIMAREYTSITAVRYMNPLLIGIYVMSMDQTCRGRVTASPLSRYGLTYLTLPLLVRLRRGISAMTRIFLISLLTRFGPTIKFIATRSRTVPMTPRAGLSV